MIPMPVLAPCCELQRPQPPDVLAGVDTVRKSRLEMEETIHEGLHVEAIDQTERSEPEETCPTEQEVAEGQGYHDQVRLHLGPEKISGADQVGAPLIHARRLPLIEPSQVRPPETAMPRAGYIVDGICVCVMIAMVRDPRARRARSIEDREENENLFDDDVEFHCTVGQSTMVTDRGAQAAQCCNGRCCEEHLPPGKGKKKQSSGRKDMDDYEINKYGAVGAIGFPPGLGPGMLLGKY